MNPNVYEAPSFDFTNVSFAQKTLESVYSVILAVLKCY